MDFWKHYDITHKDHIICNPMSSKKLDELVEILNLKEGSRILDIACGKAEFIIRCVKRYDVSAIGVDMSPYYIREAKKRIDSIIPNSNIQLIEKDGAKYEPEQSEFFDMASCIGASWIFKNHEGTLKYLIKQVKPGGTIIAGEPYWKSKPPQEYLIKAKETYDPEDFGDFGSHFENVRTGEKLDLRLIYCLVSNGDDWDKYLNLQWNAIDKYIRSNPKDPDNDELEEKVSKEREIYLKWERELFGWAIYVFRKKF